MSNINSVHFKTLLIGVIDSGIRTACACASASKGFKLPRNGRLDYKLYGTPPRCAHIIMSSFDKNRPLQNSCKSNFIHADIIDFLGAALILSTIHSRHPTAEV